MAHLVMQYQNVIQNTKSVQLYLLSNTIGMHSFSSGQYTFKTLLQYFVTSSLIILDNIILPSVQVEMNSSYMKNM